MEKRCASVGCGRDATERVEITMLSSTWTEDVCARCLRYYLTYSGHLDWTAKAA